MTASKKLIQASAGNVAGGDFYPYTVDNSARFDGASYLSKTFTTPTDSKKYTFSVWLKLTDLNKALPVIFSAVVSAGYSEEYIATYLNKFRGPYNGATGGGVQENAARRDSSSWYHLHIKVDTTQATASARIIMTVNGFPVDVGYAAYPSQNASTVTNSAVAHRIAYFSSIGGDYYFEGYMSDFVFVDGTAYNATDFGEDKNGVWIPKEITGLTFGNNGFYLDFADSAALGNDVSGNNNDWTVSGLTSSDQMIDTPTSNFCTLNPLDGAATAEGNLQQSARSSSWATCQSTMALPKTGKWYLEAVVSGSGDGDVGSMGISADLASSYVGSTTNGYGYVGANGYKYVAGSAIAYGATYGAGDIISMLWDGDNQSITFYKNGVSQGVAFTGLNSSLNYRPAVSQYNAYVTNVNFGQNGTFNGAVTAGGNSDANGIGDFKYTVPTDALALCTANLPEPTIGPNIDSADTAALPEDQFSILLYEGNSTNDRDITGVGFDPDLGIFKNRDEGYGWIIVDRNRGDGWSLGFDSGGQESGTGKFDSFITDGYRIDSHPGLNRSSIVNYSWKANGSGVSNTDGSITSTVSANTDAGISVITYTGNGSYGQTVGHGLGVAPQVVICKNLSNNRNWRSYFETLGATKYINLDDYAAAGTYGSWNNTAPTSSVFSTTDASSADRATNYSGDNFVAYCFADVEGFSSFGSYTGNGSATDGPFIYTGFRPAFVLARCTTAAANWRLYDSYRPGYNETNLHLITDGSNAEGTQAGIDMLSNGFKIRSPSGNINASGGNHIYMAFAENPFKYANAR